MGQIVSPAFRQTNDKLCRRILQLVALQCVAKLVVAKAEGGSGRALVEAASAQRVLEERPF
jgi:hypothetical protein